MHPDVKQQKMSRFVSLQAGRMRLFAGYSTRPSESLWWLQLDTCSSHQTRVSFSSPRLGRLLSHLLLTPNTCSGTVLGRPRAEDAGASFSCSFLRSIIRDYSRSSAAASRRIKVCVSEIYWPNNNLSSRPTAPSSSMNLNLHRNTIRAHIYLWQHSLHHSSLCGGNLICSSSWN